MTADIEIGKVSSRGQIAIPSEMRKRLALKEGEKVLFFSEDDTIVMKKVSSATFSELTKPLKEAARKAGMKESDAPRIIQSVRKSHKK